MPYRTLADFVDELEQAGELLRIGAEVSPEFEIAEIAARVSDSGGPALLFHNVKGCRAAVAVNLLGTEARICRAVGVDSLLQVAERIGQSFGGAAAGAWFDKLKWGGSANDRREPRWVKTGACQQVVRLGSDVDLTTLPMLRNWPQENGRLLQTGLAFTVDPKSGARNVERCDLQLLDKNRLAVLLSPRDLTSRRLSAANDGDDKIPLAIVVGGDPAYRIMAGSPFAAAFDPLPLGALLRGTAIDLVKCRTSEIGVPADADLVIEGYLDPAAEQVTAGPIGLPGGFRSLPQAAPVMQVAAITERTSPILPAIVPGHAAGETWAMQAAAGRMFLPLVQAIVPELVDFALPAWGGLQRFLFVAIRKSYAHQARRVASALWGWEPLMTAKTIVIVDADVNVQRPDEVWSRMGANVRPDRDVFFHMGPNDPTDHTSPAAGGGSLMGIDATAKIIGEQQGDWPAPLAMSHEIQEKVRGRWQEYGLPPL